MLLRIFSSLALVFTISSNSFAEDKLCVPIGSWKNPQLEIIPHKNVIKNLARQQVVLLGEDHENAGHHRWQTQTIAKLHALQPDMALAFEAFPRSTQEVLNKWVNGELSEEELLKQTDWQTNWTYNPDFYLPMFHFARMHRIPMIAMNVNRSLVSKVGKKGWANIPESEREGITDPAPAPQDYIDSLVDIFSQHMPTGGHGQEPGKDTEKLDSSAISNSPMFKNFLQGQLLWDRAMAQAIKQQRGDAKLVIGIVGAGHIMGGWGIPHQLKDQGINKTATAMPWDDAVDCEQLQNRLVDWAFGVAPQTAAPTNNRPKLGVYLEPAKKGVGVKKVVPNSVADTLGIQAGDAIIEIAGRPASQVADVVNAVQSTGWGTWLPLKILRGNKEIELIAKFAATPPD